MRKFKTVTVVFALLATMSAFATKGKKATKENSLSGQIYEMLKENQFNANDKEGLLRFALLSVKKVN